MRYLGFILVLVLFVSIMVVPAFAVDLQGGYYFVADCALGSGVKFYVPTDFMDRCLAFDSTGDLFNLTGSSVYLYSPDFTGYTIYAPRLSGFQYRAGTGYGTEYQDLSITAITETNIRILDEDPGTSLGNDQLLLVVVVLLILLIGCFVVCVRR